MTEMETPSNPVANPQQLRDTWIQRVRHLTDDVRRWCENERWFVHEGTRQVTEDEIGTYEVPTLMIQTPAGRLVFEPVARFIVGKGIRGRLDLYEFPTLRKVLILDAEEGPAWYSQDRVNLQQPWNQTGFKAIVNDLMSQAA